jgi:hypothetical protein
MSLLTASLDDGCGGRCGVDVGDGAADMVCSTPLKGLSHEMDLAFEDMYCQF